MIRSVTVERRDLPFTTPLTTGRGSVTRRAVFLVRLHAADGGVGLGEAAPLDWAGTESVEECEAALAGLLERVAGGQDPGDFLRRCPAAAAGWDQAVRDLEARRAGMPLARTLFAGASGDVAVNALVADAAGASAAVEAGFRTLKVKVGADVTGDVARLEAIRAAVGEAIDLRIDPNGAWFSATRAVAALEVLAPVGLEYCEQPVLAGEIGTTARAMAEVRERTGVAIAPDESVTGVNEARVLLDAGAADVLVLKPMRLGGLGPAMEIGALAREADVDLVVTGFLGSAVERAAALHLAAALDGAVPPGRRRAHGLGAGSWLAEDVAEGPSVVQGRVVVPSLAGHGVWGVGA